MNVVQIFDNEVTLFVDNILPKLGYRMDQQVRQVEALGGNPPSKKWKPPSIRPSMLLA